MGIMKGVLADRAPEARLVDLLHAVPAGDIRRGAITLWQARPYFPQGTIFLCVVDPGVGTGRRGLALTSSNQHFVGPDNGLFSFVLEDEFRAWELANAGFQLSRAAETFHGRDIFAPAAAALATGIRPEEFGARVDELVRLDPPTLDNFPGFGLRGEVLHGDRFGNLLTSLGRLSIEETRLHFKPWLPGPAVRTFSLPDTRLELPDGTRIPLVHTFGDIPTGEVAALIGSSGLAEIAMKERSAQRRLNLQPGDHVLLMEI